MLGTIRILSKEEKAQGEWGSVYMLVVLVIAALLLLAVVKPMFRNSQRIIKQAEVRPTGA